MTALFALVAGLLAAAGLSLAGIGIDFLARGDQVGAGIFALCIGIFVSYGGYLFARAAWRVRRDTIEHPALPAQTSDRRRIVRTTIGAVIADAAFVFAFPMPTAVRVLGIIAALLAVPVIFAYNFEPTKSRRRHGQ